MSEEEVRLRTVVDGSEESVEDLLSVSTGAEKIGTSAETAATGLGSLSTKSGVLKEVLSGVSDEMKDALREMVKLGQGGSEEANNLRVSITRVDSAVGALGTEAGRSLRTVGTEATRAATPVSHLSNTFNLAGNAAQKFENEIANGSPRAGAALSRLIILMHNLREEMNARRAAGEEISAEEEQQYAKLGARLEGAKVKLRAVNDELRDQKTELAEGGEQWTGMENALTKVAGRYGEVIALAGAATAAFKAGWEIGHTFAEAIGTDFTGMTQVMADLKKETAGTTNFLVDAFASWTAGLTEVEKKMFAVGVNTAVKWKDATLAMEGYSLALKAGVDQSDALLAKEADLIAIATTFRAAQNIGAEGHKLTAEAAEKSKGNLALYVAEMTKANPEIEAHAEKLRELAKDHRSLDQHIKDAIGPQESLRKAYAASNDLLKQQQENTGGVTAAVVEHLGQIAFWIDKGETQNAQVKIFNDELKKETDLQTSLSDSDKARLKDLTARITNIGTLDEAQRKQLATDALALASQAKVIEATDKHATAQGSLGTNLVTSNEGLSEMQILLNSIVDKLNAGTEAAGKFEAAVSKASKAGLEDDSSSQNALPVGGTDNSPPKTF